MDILVVRNRCFCIKLYDLHPTVNVWSVYHSIPRIIVICYCWSAWCDWPLRDTRLEFSKMANRRPNRLHTESYLVLKYLRFTGFYWKVNSVDLGDCKNSPRWVPVSNAPWDTKLEVEQEWKICGQIPSIQNHIWYPSTPDLKGFLEKSILWIWEATKPHHAEIQKFLYFHPKSVGNMMFQNPMFEMRDGF